ncbi:MAG: peptidase M48 [Blastocatellia bacterium]|nr:MAG: peptidase M48 [Blastocatellia bacterium]
MGLISYILILALAITSVSHTLFAGSSPSDKKPRDPVVRKYKAGGIRDLEAIGNRNVGCRKGFGNWYSLESQIQMGKEFSEEIEKTSNLITDPAVTEYVNRIGQNLVRNSDAQVPFIIKVVDSDDVNAFALPGGFFYVNSGLILLADNEAELAGVMAHEIAHVAACHVARENTRGQLMNLASIPLVFIGGGVGYAIRDVVAIAIPMNFLRFTRGFEMEADFLGLEYLYKAGYDPQAFTAFFERVQAMEKKKSGTLAKAFDTHPQTGDRLAKSQLEIQTLLPPEQQYKLDTSEFQDVKSRLLQLQNRHKIKEDFGRPTLRRNTIKTGDDSDKTDRDRPTLKHRDGTQVK